MKILVTGGAGYIGSVLVRELLKSGHHVVCLDRFFFGKEPLADVLDSPKLTLVNDDIRWFEPNILKHVDAVMDLAAISNDPAGELDPNKTIDINFLGRSRVARLTKEYGVKRYILASSCSIYGFQDEILDETSTPRPLTTYAKATRNAEEDIIRIADSDFAVTILRFATVYGLSGRMRFDLAVNAMVLSLFKGPNLPVMREGTQWRPFIHIRDATQAYQLAVEKETDKVGGEIINVGSDEQNFQILSLAKLVGSSLKVDYNIEWYGTPDSRSYRVSFKKCRDLLGLTPSFSPTDGALEIYNALQTGKLKESLKTRTVDWYKYLLECHKVSSDVSLRGTII